MFLTLEQTLKILVMVVMHAPEKLESGPVAKEKMYRKKISHFHDIVQGLTFLLRSNARQWESPELFSKDYSSSADFPSSLSDWFYFSHHSCITSDKLTLWYLIVDASVPHSTFLLVFLIRNIVFLYCPSLSLW